MRNLKRALSLAVASVMLLGLMVVGTGAVSVDDFGDADQIASENQEAVAISVGLGIFAGADGNFLPDQPVTRAEMATIICKLLYGNDVNADNFKGAGTFQDTANYQSGWAEGYINMCASLGIVSGYNESAFGPGDTVTTWQAALMLQRALGYWNSASSESINELTVTTRATQLGFFGDLTLGANEPLTREDVAVMAFNALFAQRVAYDDYRGLYVKANDRNVVVTNGTDDEMNTLAQNTYGLYIAEGVVVSNGYTEESLSASLRSDAQTEIMFTEDTDLNKDGRNEYVEGDTYCFTVDTDLDMIGHAANVYYKIERKAPVVYAIVDDATLVDVIDYDTNTTRLAQAANDAGFRRNTVLNVAEADYIVNYDFGTTVQDLIDAKDSWVSGEQVQLTTAGRLANGIEKKLVVISNSGDLTVDYVIILDQYLDTVDMVEEDDRYDTVEYILSKGDGIDMNVPVGTVKEDDFVIVTDIGNQGDVFAIQTAQLVGANITRITGVSNPNSDVTRITADGDYYYESTVSGIKMDADVFTAFVDISTIGEATLILDQFGDLVGLAEEAAPANYAYVAQYGVRHSTSGLNTKYVLTAHVYFANGTNGIYEVDVDDSDAIFEDAGEKGYDDQVPGYNNTFGQTTSAAIGLWDVTVQSDDTIRIEKLVSMPDEPQKDDVQLIKGHSTLLKDGANVTAYFGKALYQNNETVYFYVNGDYDDDTLTVDVVTGIKNVKGFTNDGNATGSNKGIQQTFVTPAKSATEGRNVVDTMLIYGVEISSSDVYYYDQGNYHTERAEGGIILVYEVYDNDTGEAVEVTYDNNGRYFDSASDAQEHAKNLEDGFYTIGATNLEPFFTYSTDTKDGSQNGVGKGPSGSATYVVNDYADYDEYAENLFSQKVDVGSITDETIVVDICDSGLDSIREIANAIRDKNHKGNVTISYSYDSDYVTDVIFVTAYYPDGTVAPGGDGEGTSFSITKLSKDGTDFKINLKAGTAIDKGTVIKYEIYYVNESEGNALVVSDEYTLKGNQVAGANIPVNTGTAVGENGNYYVVVTIDGETVTSPTYRITK